MTDRTLTSDALWCRRTFDSLKVGGVWGVPRSGLIFTRTGEDTLALTDKMPPVGPPYEDADDDYAVIARHMADAGITVTDETKEQE